MRTYILPVILAVPGLLLVQSEPVHGSASAADSVHFCVPFDYEQWRRDHPRPAAKGLADLDVGEPRTVRMIYFLPNDRPLQQPMVDSMKVVIRRVQAFYAEQMEAHGYGKTTFQIETDAQGQPLVHRFDGQHGVDKYDDDPHEIMFSEIREVFDTSANVYIAIVDGGGGPARGGGSKSGGEASSPVPGFVVMAHELGHAFGLPHDFRDGDYIMSYGPRRINRLSACAAEFLAVHPYFNSDSSLETDRERAPTVEVLSLPTYPAGRASVPVRLKVADSKGLQQVLLGVLTREGGARGFLEVKACQGLSGDTEAVVEFEYDGKIPSSVVSSLSDPIAHPIRVQASNSEGDVGHASFVFSEISPHLVATLDAHGGEVNSVAFSPDGKTLASLGSWEGEVKLWSVSAQRSFATLRHTDAVSSLSFSSLDGTLATGSLDRTIKLWNGKSGRQIATLEGHTDGVTSVEFAAGGGSLLASGSRDGTVKLWDVGTRAVLGSLEAHTSAVTSVAVSPDGTILASASATRWDDDAVKLWDLGTREQIGTLEGHTYGVTSVSISPDGATLAAGSGNGSVILWDVVTGEEIATLEHHSSRVDAVSFSSPDGSILASSSWDGTVILWDLLTRKKIADFGHTQQVFSVSLSPGGATLAAGVRDGKVVLWDVSEWMGPRPFAMEIVSGDGQQGAPGAVLAQPLMVEVRDQYGALLPDAEVTFTVTAGEGQLSGLFAVEHARTDAEGRAGLPLTLGLHPGPNTVGVSLRGHQLATFHAEGVGTAVAELEGDYRTWHLPAAATVRLGKGALGESDRAVALSADGRCLAVASALGVWLYEAATSRAQALLPTERPVHSVSFSLGGTLAAGLDNGGVELWEVETGERIGTLRHGGWSGLTVALSPDGTRLASRWRQEIKLWDVAAGRLDGTWEVPTDVHWHGAGQSVAFSPDGSTLVSGFQDGTVRLWDVANQTEVVTLEGHTDWVLSVSFSPDGSLLASAGGRDDRTVRLWNAATKTEVATLRGHRGEVRSLEFSSPDGGTLASAGGGRDPTIRLWNVATREPIRTLEEHTAPVHSVTYSRDGATLASGSADGRVLLRNLASRNAAGLSGHESSSSMAFSRDGALVAWGSQDGTIKLWNAVTQTQIVVLQGHTDEVAAVAFSPDGALLASAGGGWEDPLKLWDVATRRQVGTLGRSWGINTISLSSPEGGRLATGSWDGKITLWDVATRALIGTLKGHTDVRSVAFSPDGATLASGGGYEDKTVKLWDVATLEPIATVEGHTRSVASVAFAPGGGILASGAGDGIMLWDVATWEPIGALEGAGGNTVSFSHDGIMLASGSRRRVTLWDVATRSTVATLEGHARSVNQVALSPDRMNLVSGSDDGTILLWDVTEWTGPRPSALEIISGDGQQGEPGAELTQPLVVEVRDQYGDPLPDAEVTFTVTAGEGQLSDRFAVEHATTDARGRAELPLTLGLHPGPNTVGVSIGGRELATFHAEGVGTAVAELEGDYRTWHLPAAATVRLGKGALGESDRAVALSADGRCLAVASVLGVWLYEAATSRAQALLPTESRVHSVSFSLGGTLAAGLDNGGIELWGVETGERIGTLRHGGWSGLTVALSPDGTRLASRWRQEIKLWDVAAGRLDGTWEVPTNVHRHGAGQSVAFSPDGSTLVSGFQDGTVRLWDVANQTEVVTLEGHTDWVLSVSFSPDGSLLASAGGPDDRTVRLWNAATQTEIATLRGHTGEVSSVAFSSPDGGTLASGSSDGTVRLWDVAAQEETATLEEQGDRIRSVMFSRDGATLVSAAADGTVLLREVETGNVAGLSGHASLSSMALSRDGVLLASGYQDGTIRLWDAATRTTIATLEGHSHGVGSVSFSSDGALLASGSGDRTVKLWDVANQTEVVTLEGHTGWVTSVSFSPDGATLASAGGRYPDDATVRLWDVKAREPAGILEGHTLSVESVAFSPSDGALLASAGGDRTVKLWDVGSRELIGTLEGHRGRVGTVAFSPDGKTLASALASDPVASRWDGIRLWDVATRTSVGRYWRGRVHSLAFSPDGSTLVSGLQDGTVRLWDVEILRSATTVGSVTTLQGHITTLQGHIDEVHSLALSRDGATLASGARDGTMLLWNLQPHPQSLTKVPGRRQQGAAGTVLTRPFEVLVLDQYGDPLPGATVTFAVTAGDGTLSAATATTDADGRAATILTLGLQQGTNTVEAAVDRLQPVTFTAVGWDTATTLDKLSGDDQQGPAGTPLTEPFVVEVRDQTGAAHAGAGVLFSITAGGGTLSVRTATTDADGRAATTLTLGRQPGTNTVRATVSGLQPVTFTATAEATPDFDGDGVTDFSDFFLFAEAFGGSDPRFDLDSNGTVDFTDFFLFAESFGEPARAKLVAMARELIGLPEGPQLRQNAPNPFNSGTVIFWFQLQPGLARLEVFALTGQRVAVLHEGPKKAGFHHLRWEARDDQGRPLASGIYVYRLVTAEAVQTRKLTLLR